MKIGDVIYVEPTGEKGSYGLRQVPQINGAIVAMDPHTGRVLAMSGGFSYASSQFDRAMQAQRQRLAQAFPSRSSVRLPL